MKTDRFDKAIREKLAGIQPEFSEHDWNRFQEYYKANTPGRFWRSHRSYVMVGAAAVLTVLTGVCGFLYHQTVSLREELAGIKAILAKQEQVGSKEARVFPETKRTEDHVWPKGDSGFDQKPKSPATVVRETVSLPLSRKTGKIKDERDLQREPPLQLLRSEGSQTGQAFISGEEVELTPLSPGYGKTLKEVSQIYREKAVVLSVAEMKMPLHLTEKKGTKFTKETNTFGDASSGAEAETVLPSFITSRPYRVGVSGSRAKNMYSIGVVNEFLILPRISVIWGLSRALYDELEYLNEKAFLQETKQHFRRDFGKTIPIGGEAMNIKTRSLLTQIPLFLSYRQSLRGGFSVTAGVGTHLNVRFRQKLAYDFWDGHKLREWSGLRYRKQNYPFLNNVSPVLGVEKIFDPLVLQAEIFYHFQKDDIPYRQSADDFGARLKLSYQFGQ